MFKTKKLSFLRLSEPGFVGFMGCWEGDDGLMVMQGGGMVA
jgi:hypothetical protein